MDTRVKSKSYAVKFKVPFNLGIGYGLENLKKITKIYFYKANTPNNATN